MWHLALRFVKAPACLLLCLILVGLTSCGGDGLEKHPVSGVVQVNGAPAPLVAVQFHSSDASVAGNAGRPVGVTDEQGVYSLSTNGESDGAVAGDYVVTFVWLTENAPTATDRFQGRYADPSQSTFKATVKEGPNEIPSFQIEFDESKALPPPAPEDGMLP